MRIGEIYNYLRWLKNDCRKALRPLRELMSFTKGDKEQLETLRKRVGYIWHIADNKLKEVDEWQHFPAEKREILLDSLPRMMNKMFLVRIDADMIFKKYEKAEDKEQSYLDEIGRALSSIEEHHKMMAVEIADGNK